MAGEDSKGYSGSFVIRILKGLGLLLALLAASMTGVNMIIFWLPAVPWLFINTTTAPSLTAILTSAGFTVAGVLAIAAIIFLWHDENKPASKERSIIPVVLTAILFLATLALTLFANIYFNAPSSQLGIPNTPFFTIASTLGAAAFLAYAIHMYVQGSNEHSAYLRAADNGESTRLVADEQKKRLVHSLVIPEANSTSNSATVSSAPQQLATTSSAVTNNPDHLTHRVASSTPVSKQ